MHFKLLNAGQEDGDRSADAMNPFEAYAASATAIETLHQEMMEKDKERLVEEEACCVCGEGVRRTGLRGEVSVRTSLLKQTLC